MLPDFWALRYLYDTIIGTTNNQNNMSPSTTSSSTIKLFITALRYFVIGVLFLIPFTPLVFYKYLFFPYITGKNFYFRILIELALAAYVVLAMLDRSFLPKFLVGKGQSLWLSIKKSPILWALSSLVLIMGVATIFSANPYKSFWSNFERMDGYITTLHMAAFFLVSAAVLNSKRLWYWFWHTSLIASIIVGIVALQDLFATPPIDRIYGTLGNSTYLGVYVLFNIFVAAYFLVREIRIIDKNNALQVGIVSTLYVAGIIFDAFILFHTGTRGSFLGLLIGGLFTLVSITFFEKGQGSKMIRIVSGTILGISLCAVLFLGFFSQSDLVKNNTFLSRFSAPISAVLHGDFKSFAESQGEGRLLIWGAAIKGVEQRPIIGWGQESFNYVFNSNYSPAMFSQEQWFDRTHNVFLDWLIDGGVLGLIAYLALFVGILYLVWKKEDSHDEKNYAVTDTKFSLSDKAFLTGLLIAYFVHNLFVFDNLVSYIMFFTLLAYVHTVSSHYFEKSGHEKALEGHGELLAFDVVAYVVSPVVVILLIACVYFVNVKPFEASVSLIDALNPYVMLNSKLGMVQGNVRARTPQESMAAYKKALSYNTLGDQEIREQILSAALNNISSQSVATDQKQAYFDFAHQEFDKQIALTPKDARPYILFGSFLNSVNLSEQALPYLNKALSLSPGKQTILYQIGYAYAGKNDYKTAASYFQKAYEEDKSNVEAQTIYATVAIYMNDFTLADSIIGTSTITDDRLIHAYTLAKKYDKVVEINKEKVAANPNDGQAHVSLAASYVQVGDRVDAVAEINKAIQIAPSFQSQGETLIKQIEAGQNPMEGSTTK